MKKSIILVPKDQCPLDIIASLGERTRKAWLLLHKSVVEKLSKTADHVLLSGVDQIPFAFVFDKTSNSPETQVYLQQTEEKEFFFVSDIEAEDIAFTTPATKPKEEITIKMST